MQTIKLPAKNFPAQQSIFDSPVRYKIVVKGRRFGLTKGAANDFIVKALTDQFTQGLWIDTVVTNINRYVERYFIPVLKLLPDDMWHWRKQEKILEIKDSYIDFRSVDRPENIEGFGYDKLFINEAGIVLKNEYLWHNAVQPMLFDFPDLSAVIGGTPKGKGIFYDLAERGKDNSEENKDYQYFYFTSFDNPYLQKDILQREIESVPDRVKEQEYYAQFLDDTGVVFRNITRLCTATPERPIKDRTYVMGVDLARVQDYTVIVVYDQKTNVQVYQDRFKELDWGFQKRKIRTIAKHFNNALVCIDASGVGDPIADDLLRAGVAVEPYKFTNQSKKELIEKLVIWTEQEKIQLLRVNETVQEFTNFTYDVTKSGRILYAAPLGLHDDIVMAHALAVYCLYDYKKPEKQKSPSRIRQEYQRQVELYERQEEGDLDPWI